MKPHIVKFRGVWLCAYRSYFGAGILWPQRLAVGEGYSFEDAYEDWRIQMEAQRA